MNQEDLERFAQEFEAQQPKTEQPTKVEETVTEIDALPVVKTEHKIAERTVVSPNGNFTAVVGGVQQDILERAQKKISSEKIVDKHAENLKKVADEALRVQAEQASLTVQEQEADNKVRRQEIKNKLIVLKAEAKRLEKEQKQLNKEQRADHKARNKESKWELYKDKLQKMGYSYVPNVFILSMLLFFDGIKSFFNGVEAVSTAAVKALKWVLLIGAILIVLFAIPVTREWLTNLLSGGK